MVVIGQERIAEVFGVAPKTIVEWQEAGFPVALRGSPGVPSQYETKDCIAWFSQREVERAGYENQKDRLNRLQGDKLERELRVMDRELIEQREIEPAWSQWHTDHREVIDGIPDKWCDAIVAVGTDPVAVHQALADIARQLKDSAASYEFCTAATAPDPAEGLRDAAPAAAVRVGRKVQEDER